MPEIFEQHFAHQEETEEAKPKTLEQIKEEKALELAQEIKAIKERIAVEGAKEEDYQKLQEEVKKEPKEALISGKEGTEFYEKIVNSLKDFLKEEGFFAFEVGIGQAEKVKQILEDNGYKNIEIYKDLAGIDRVIIASEGFKRIGD